MVHSNEARKFRCPYDNCLSNGFIDNYHLKRHIKAVHDENFVCNIWMEKYQNGNENDNTPIPKYRFKKKKQLARHKFEMHEKPLSYTWKFCSKVFSVLKQYTVFDIIQSRVCLISLKFDKLFVVGNFIEQNLILKILVLKSISRKIFLIFLFIWYDTAIIKQSSSYFFGKFYWSVCFCKLSMKEIRAISSSTSSVTSDHLKSISISSL